MPPKIVVVGAGAFGGWTALELLRRGAQVTLVDAWGPGNTRASSGGETRVIRATYGNQAIYTRMAIQALARWREYDRSFQTEWLRMTGVLWMLRRDDAFGAASVAAFRAERHPIDVLSVAAARRRYPQINFDGVASVLFEPEAGYLLARRACEHVAARVVAEGGAYVPGAVKGPLRLTRRVTSVPLIGGGTIDADGFVFACGPWLGSLFPDEVGSAIRSTRQDVFYFGTPLGDHRYSEEGLPIWLDMGRRVIYGIPGNANRGFKVADDTSGPPIDPTTGSRVPLPAGLRRVRAFLARRFPKLAGAPLLGTEVCQVQSDRRLPLRHRPASPRTQRLDRRRRIRPRVQDGAGGRGNGRGCRARAVNARLGILARAVRARPA